MKRRYRFVLFFTILSVSSISGQLENFSNPLVFHVTNASLKATEVRELKQTPNGLYFIASAGGLIESNGVKHFTYNKGKLSNLIAIHALNDSIIYSGGNGGFGRWEKTAFGEFTYESLHYVAPTKTDYLQPRFTDVVLHNDQIVFQSLDYLYYHDLATGALVNQKAKTYFTNIFKTKNHLFSSDFDNTIFKIENGEEIVFQSFTKKNSEIVEIIELENNSFLFISKNGELWKKENKRLTQVAKFDSVQINDAIQTEQGELVLGTTQNGIYFLDATYEVKAKVKKGSGLSSDYVRNVYEDRSQNIWASSDLGIHLISRGESITEIIDENKKGVINDFLLDKNVYFKATNQGLFAVSKTKGNHFSQLIPNSQGINWGIEKIDGEIFVGHEDGVFTYKNNQLKPLHNMGVWNFKQHPKRKDLIYCGTYNGIILLKKTDNRWSFYKRLDGFYDSSRFMEFDRNTLWVCHPAKGFFEINLDSKLENVVELEFHQNFKAEDRYFYNYFFKMNEEIVFYNPTGFYKFDYTDDRFYPSQTPSEIFKGLQGISQITQIDNYLYFGNSKAIGKIDLEDEYKRTIFPLSQQGLRFMGDFLKFKKLQNNIIGFNAGGKPYVYENSKTKTVSEKQISKPIIKKIIFKGTTDEIVKNINQKSIGSIPYNNNSLQVEVLIPSQLSNPNHTLEYKLNDNDKWRTSNNNFLVDISSIPINENNLQLRISNLEGNVSESIKYDFTINQLWYLSANAIRLYIIGVLVIYGIAYMAIRRKNNIDKKKFIEREKEKQREKIRQLEIGKLKVDKERLQLEQEKLQLELKNHNQEIAYSTYNNVKKNEMLRSLKEYIFKINGVDKGNGLNQKMKSIVSKIDNTFDDSNDWVKFDYHFKKANPNFFDRLSELHTNLTANDKRICAFMKMQIPTKQIASFLNINVKSLEMTRYRLRKKLKLKSRTDLYTYIQSI